MTATRPQAVESMTLEGNYVKINFLVLLTEIREKPKNSEIERLMSEASCEAIEAVIAEILEIQELKNKTIGDSSKSKERQKYSQLQEPLSELIAYLALANKLYKPHMTKKEFAAYADVHEQMVLAVEKVHENHCPQSIRSALFVILGILGLAVGILLALTLGRIVSLPVLLGIPFFDVTNAVGGLLAGPIIASIGLYGLFKKDKVVESSLDVAILMENNIPQAL